MPAFCSRMAAARPPKPLPTTATRRARCHPMSDIGPLQSLELETEAAKRMTRHGRGEARKGVLDQGMNAPFALRRDEPPQFQSERLGRRRVRRSVPYAFGDVPEFRVSRVVQG